LINQPPVAPHSLIAFSQRDFVSISGYQQTETLTVEIIHSATYGGGVTTVTGLVPVDDPSTPDPNDGVVEINHSGGYCWVGQTPDIRPGDILRVTVEQTNIADQTVIANITTKRAVQSGPNTITVQGTAQTAAGTPIPVTQLEHRLISPGNRFDLSGKRTLRADSTGTSDGTLAYDVAVTEYGIYRDSIQIATVISGRSYVDTGLVVGSYNYTIDAADAAGNRSAQSPVVVATVTLVPDTTAPSAPTNLVASVPNVRARNIVISWSAATDDIGVSGYTLYRDGVAIATLNGSTLSYADNNRPAETYSYTVDAFDSAGNRSAQSDASIAAVANDSPCVPVAHRATVARGQLEPVGR
jgi:hypothetical protein